MVYRKLNGCPYLDCRLNRCTHKSNDISHCPFNNPDKCKQFVEWQEEREKLLRAAEAANKAILDGGMI